MEVSNTLSAVRQAVKEATQGLVERETIVDLILLSAVAREHLLIIGPPGTAKSAAVRRISQALGGKYFEYLLGRFTEPSEIFGPVDIRKLSEGVVETATDGMLPEAEIAFLDEVFLGSTAILNTLLGVLNERRFKRGHTQIDCPLRICVAASNHLPEDETLAAFADRFLVHCFVEPVADAQLEELLRQGWWAATHPPVKSCEIKLLDTLAEQARQADMSLVQPLLAKCVRLLRKEGIQLSDRRVVKAQGLISAAATLAGRSQPTEADLWPLLYAVPTRENQESAREILSDALRHCENDALSAAAEAAANSPAARAARLAEKAEALLQEEASHERRSRFEALGREIDAGFAPDALPERLSNLRQRLQEALTQHEAPQGE
ncbi:AAA family ATPase [Hahella sp. HN01]|uniref:AAA family ATPase n=1 Tax=Hahella sp. HN01 TaxID=2847262 RepID=UPI001C1F1D23|nr:AAA family ATPase [Hahella sp. HN01]MBU6954477.1 AAA family ATPase [Hahella sp. HN01]